MSDSERSLELTISREIDVPRERVWEAWTDPEQLKQWFTPRPYTTPECSIDLRPGGVFYTKMRDPEGNEFPGYGVYLEVVAPARLVFTDAYTEAWKPSEKPFMTATIELDDLGGGRTRYTATAAHWNLNDAKAHEEMGFFQGWNTALDQLVEFIESRR